MAAKSLQVTVGGFTMIELLVTLTVLSVLSLGVIPLVQTAVRRQREQMLREELRQMREAIKEFHRDTIGMQCAANGLTGTTSGSAGSTSSGPAPSPSPGTPPVGGGNVAGPVAGAPTIDPRSRVYIADCSIFSVDNPDRYPPKLETLVEGVNVLPRVQSVVSPQDTFRGDVVDRNKLGNETSFKKKVYLRAIPVDPFTGKAEWDLRSSYDAADAGSWGGENVFDVHSLAPGTALNGEKYSDW